MSKTTGELTFNQKSALDLLEAQATSLHTAAKTLDDKAHETINFSSLIVAIIGVFKFQWNDSNAPLSPDANRLFVCIFVAYGFAFLYCVIARFPRQFAMHPMKPQLEEVTKWVNSYTISQHYSSLVRSYLAIIQHNQKVLAFKSILTRAALLVIGLVMFLIAVLVLSEN